MNVLIRKEKKIIITGNNMNIITKIRKWWNPAYETTSEKIDREWKEWEKQLERDYDRRHQENKKIEDLEEFQRTMIF